MAVNRDSVNRGVEFITAILLVSVVLIVGVQVVCRYILKVSLPWSEEISRYLFLWGTFLGAGVAFVRGSHISIDSLAARLSDTARRRLESIVAILVAAFSLLVVYQGTVAALAVIRDHSNTMRFSLAWVYAAVPVAGLFFVWSQWHVVVTRRAWGWACIAAIAVVLLTTALVVAGKYMSVSPNLMVIMLFGVLFILIALNTPISIAIGLACLVYLLLSHRVPLVILPISMIGGIDSFILLAVPLFILAGDLMNTGGITERLVTFARALVGHVRGSLGISSVIGEYIFSGISGSSVADVSAVGSVLIPSMKRAGYRPEVAVSIVASASAMGMLVPPCVPMIVMASLTNLSVAALFIAGFVPAACISVMLIALVYIQARREGIPREKRQSATELLRAFRRAILPLLTPVIILGGILGGIVTPTEAGMLAVIYALILGMLVYREIRPRDLVPILVNAASLTGMVMFMVGTASLLSWICAAEGIPLQLASWMLKLSTNPAPFLLITIITFVVFGAILEGLPAQIILTPIFFPIISRFGLIPLHYGIVVITALGIGLFQPPFGIGFLIASALGHVNVETCTRAYLPYMIVLFIGILIIAFVPWFTLVLPRIMNFS